MRFLLFCFACSLLLPDAPLAQGAVLHPASKQTSDRKRQRTSNDLTAREALHAVGDRLPGNVLQALRGGDAAAPGGGGTVLEGAVALLNSLISQSWEREAKIQLQCVEKESEYRELYERTKRESELADQSATAAQAHLSSLIDESTKAKTEASVILEYLTTLEQHCLKQKEDVQERLALLRHDLAVAKEVLKNSPCREKGANTPTSLLRCTQASKGGSFLAVSSSHKFHTVERIVLPRSLSASILSALGDTGTNDPSPISGPRQTADTEMAVNAPQGLPHREVVSASLERRSAPRSTYGGRVRGADAEGSSLALGMCAASVKETNCAEANDHMSDVVGRIDSKIVELKQEETRIEQSCAKGRLQHQAEYSSHVRRLATLDSKLGESTAEVKRLLRAQTEKRKTLDGWGSFLSSSMHTCESSRSEMTHESCALQRIRRELMLLKGNHTVITDCQMTDWEFGVCTAKCGGGELVMSRKVIAAEIGGAPCPAVQMKGTCNTAPCGVDCALSEWTDWSRCSSNCGGGVRARFRTVLTEPSRGGKGCGPTTEVEPCEQKECAPACPLGDWGPWSVCDRPCGGGISYATREPEGVALGSDQCPSIDDPLRVKFKDCNEHTCPSNPTCQGMVDILLLLDRSGSVGPEGVKSTNRFATALMQAMTPNREKGAMMGVVVFSDTAVPVVRLTDSVEGLRAGLKKSIPAGATNTPGALGTAPPLIMEGRADASTVVVVVTDGPPARSWMTKQASEVLQERGARVVFAGVGTSDAEADYWPYVSFPSDRNVISVKDFPSLGQASVIQKFVHLLCPKIPPAQPTKFPAATVPKATTTSTL